MITMEQYFGAKKHTEEQEVVVADLLSRVEALSQEYYAATSTEPDIDPDTGTEISGKKNGAGDGGFRLQTSTTGAGNSSHKVLPADKPVGAGVDKSDQDNAFDKWLDQFEDGKGGNSKLEEYGLYREDPAETNTWCHLTNRRPGTGHRTFKIR